MGFAKRAIEAALAHAGPAALSRRRFAGRTLVIAWHNIIPSAADAGADGSLHLPLDRFEAQLDRLLRTHDVVPLDDVLAPVRRGARPRAVLTFDDAYAGAVHHGLGLLAARRLPATMFVAPGRLGGQAFWWDAWRGASSSAFREFVLSAGGGRDTAATDAAGRFDMAPADIPAPARTATEQDLRDALGRHPELTLGSHTWSHPNLAALSGRDLQEEVERPLEWLRAFGERGLPWIAYPYGLRSAASDDACRRAGYRAGLLVEGGWVPGVHQAYQVPRFNVPAGLSPDGFTLRLAGLLHG